MSVTSSENALTDDICHAGFTPLSSCHVLGNIDPKPVLGYAVLEVLAVEVNRVALKFEPEEPDELDLLAIEDLGIGDQLDHADVLSIRVELGFREIAFHLGDGRGGEQAQRSHEEHH